MSSNNWPDLPEITKDDPRLDFKKLHYQAQLEVIKAQQLADIETAKEKANKTLDYEHACRQAVYNAYLDVAKGQIERVQARAAFIEKAASVIGGAYGVILGLSFNISKDISRLPPARSLAPPFFLGLSLVLAAIYLAYITPTRRLSEQKVPPESTNVDVDVDAERSRFIKRTTETVLRRVRWLQSAVISLGFGVLSLPVAFLSIQDNIVGTVVAVSLIIIFLPFLIPFFITSVIILSDAEFIYWRLKSLIWPTTPQEAAKLFGGLPDRWKLSYHDGRQWALEYDESPVGLPVPVEINTYGLLAGGYNGKPPSIDCYVWVGKQTVTKAVIYRDFFPSHDASRVADALIKNSNWNPEHKPCKVLLR